MLQATDTLGLDLEEGLVTGQADIVAALGRTTTQACSLTTGQQDDTDLPTGMKVSGEGLGDSGGGHVHGVQANGRRGGGDTASKRYVSTERTDGGG